MRLTEIYSNIMESAKTSAEGLNILKNANVENPEAIIAEFSKNDKSKNQKNIPMMAFIYASGYQDMKNIIEVINDYNELETKKQIKPIQIIKKTIGLGDKQFNDFIKLSEYIHSVKASKADKKSEQMSVAKDFVANKKPMWSGNGIDIYEGTSVGKCIAYTQGGLTGKAYSFCIGQPANTMYKSYRDTKDSSFYFIIDRNHFKEDSNGNVDLSDPLHIVVFDNTKYGIELTDADNHTGTISKYGDNADAYVDYLTSKGVPVEKLVNKPKTEQEAYEDALLGKRNESLEWFVNLDNPNNPKYKKPVLEPGETEHDYYKSAYIGRGHLLTDDQFEYLLNN